MGIVTSWTRKQALLGWPCTVQEAVEAPEPVAGEAMSAEPCRRAATEEAYWLSPRVHWLVVAGLRQEGLLVREGVPAQEGLLAEGLRSQGILYGVAPSHQACRQGNLCSKR